MLISEENGVLTHHERRFSDEDPDPDIIPNVRGKYHCSFNFVYHISYLTLQNVRKICQN